MKAKQLFLGKFSRSIVIATAVTAVAIVTVVTGTVLASGGASSSSPSKQQILAQAQSAEATAAAGPRAPKPSTAGQGLPSTASCPQTVQTGIFPYNQPPWHDDVVFTTVAGMISTAGNPYNIYAGSRESDPQQGLVVVERIEKDPCAVWAGRAAAQAYTRTYLYPSRAGALTLTQVSGDTVSFTVGSTVHGSFDVVSGQYLNG